jgi:hypothetical protein
VNKLPVGPAIRFAYGFTFGQLGHIIGLIWAPMIVIAVLRFLPYALGDALVPLDPNAAASNAAQLRIALLTLATLFFYAGVCVSVTELALGLRKGGAAFHIALGRAAFRLWGAFLLLALLLVALLFTVYIAAHGTALWLAHSPNAALADDAVAAVLFLGACLIVFVTVRLSFLLVPVSMVEGRFGFERGWRLTRGNFWRISGVMFVVSLPVVALILSAFFGIVGPELIKLRPIMSKLTWEILQDRVQLILSQHMAMLIGIDLIAAPFLLGLTLGAGAYAYRALSKKPPPP